MRYRLASDLACCIVDGSPVLLDLQRDRYLTVPDKAAPVFLRVLEGSDIAVGDTPTLSQLIKRNYLIPDTGNDEWRFRPPERVSPTRDFSDSSVKPRRRVVLMAAFELLGASISLRVRGLHRTLQALTTERRTCRSPSTREEVSAAFSRLTLLWSANDRCLVRSIAMKRLLNRFGLDADLLVGVALRPFTAHCWIQYDGCVLNDDAERARRFTVVYKR